ncbi:MAG: aspartyl protease family protein, partial [Acidobacteria bacterium]|nr:aspartyl protease family protein [Acidobacteriota bacterium]
MRRTALLLLPFLIAASTFAAGPLTKQQALDRWAAALGGRAKLANIQAVQRELAFRTGGIDGTDREWITAKGQARTEVEMGGFSSVTIFDGHEGWAADGDAQPHRLAGPDLTGAITTAYLDSYAQFFPERGKASITLQDGEYATLVITPEGGREIRVLLDKKTWLPHAMIQPLQERTQTVTFLSWKEAGGVKFPSEILQSTGDAKFDVRMTTKKIDVNPAVDVALFAKPEPRLAAIAFPNGAKVVTSPFRLVQNHIYFPISVNGAAPADFIFDTGAEFTLIDRKRAEALGLKMAGAIEARGSGPNSAQTSLIADPRISFAGLTMPLDVMAALDLGALSLREGKRIEGIIGYGVLSRFIIDVDYAKSELRFHDPASFVANAQASVLPVQFHGNLPIVTVKVTDAGGATHEAHLLIDTGARNAVVLAKPFLDRTKLAEGKTIAGLLGAGVGGATAQRIGRLQSIELAGMKIDAPITSFSTATSGAEADPNVDGLIGGDILKRFTLTIDYPHERLLLAKNAAFGEPFEFDMSGAYFVAVDEKLDRFRVDNVIAGSPAANAGVAAGDELVSIDGKMPASLET